MKKQYKQNIFKSVLLLLSVVLLAAGSVVAILANTTITKELTITFDADVDKCIVYVKNSIDSDWEVLGEVTESGTVVSVPYNQNVKLTVIPAIGKWPVIVVEGETISTTQGNSVSWNPFKESASVSITCVDRTYVIHALNYDQKEDIEYSTVEGSKYTIDQLTHGEVTYQYGAQPLTELPAVQKEDYTFHGWKIKMGEGPNDFLTIKADENGKYCIPQDLTRTNYFDSNGTIYVYPDLRGVEYPIYREDRVYDSNSSSHHGDKLFGAVEQSAVVNTTIFADANLYWIDDIALGGYKQYTGYLMMESSEVAGGYKGWIVGDNATAGNQYYNTVVRFYKPIEYKLTYDLNDKGDVNYTQVEQYIYANPTSIASPSRRGYTFLGWQIAIYNAETGEWINPLGKDEFGNEKLTDPNSFTLGNGNASFNAEGRNDPNAIFASDAQADGTYEIKLVAQWSANTYEITYPWGDIEDLITNKAELPTSFTFDATCFIPNPYRPGYTFNGWTVYTNGGSPVGTSGLTEADGGYYLSCTTYVENISLTADWVVESYSVEFDDDISNTTNVIVPNVEYDKALPIDSVEIPVKYGYNFMGYFSTPDGDGEMYFNAEGNCVVTKWGLDGENGGTITLYARWERKSVSVTVNPLEKVPGDVKITIYDSQTHAPYEGNPATLLFGAKFYVKIELPEGFKIVEWNGIPVSVHEGNVFRSQDITIDTEDAIVLGAMARPDAPRVGVGEDVGTLEVEPDASIKVPFANAEIAGRYEVAISRNEYDTNLVWNQIASGESSYLFTGLNPGTTYYVFIRLAETADTHSGIPAHEKVLTRYDAYVNETIANLNGMFQEGDGKVTQALIQNAVNKIEELRNSKELPGDFYEQINALIAGVEAKIAFTRFQDAKIASLEDFLNQCFLSGSFSEQNKYLLEALCTAAVIDIGNAERETDIQTIHDTAMAAMKEISVTYLYTTNEDTSITLQSAHGLQQGGGIVLKSVEDIQALRRAIADAIAKGSVADGFVSAEDAKELLRVLDTICAYNFYLVNVQPTEGDSFIITLTIPEALAGRTGLQVAYYNTATGRVELLKTIVDGNTLTFHTNQVTDFVILADPTVDLSYVIIALGALVLCLLIAILLVLATRNSAKNSVQHASVALPMFLAIHFVPVNAGWVALALGIVAILLMAVLMWLLLSSSMIRTFKAKKAAFAKQEVTAVVREEDLTEASAPAFDGEEEVGNEDFADEQEQIDDEQNNEEFVDDEINDEFIENGYADEIGEDEFVDEYANEEEIAEETFAEETFEEETEEVYDDEEFVEETNEDYSSAYEEENVYEFDEEETERVSDAEETDSATEDQADDTDPFDGVFGEGDVQDGYAPDEAGDSRYEDSYGDSYEVGDEAYAAQTETEDADRAEEEGQGTVDPYAYIVTEDGEVISNEEEMYQYDE